MCRSAPSDESAAVGVARQSTLKLYVENTGPHQQIGVNVFAQIASKRDWFNKSAISLLDFVQLETSPTQSEIFDEKSSTVAGTTNL